MCHARGRSNRNANTWVYSSHMRSARDCMRGACPLPHRVQGRCWVARWTTQNRLPSPSFPEFQELEPGGGGKWSHSAWHFGWGVCGAAGTERPGDSRFMDLHTRDGGGGGGCGRSHLRAWARAREFRTRFQARYLTQSMQLKHRGRRQVGRRQEGQGRCLAGAGSTRGLLGWRAGGQELGVRACVRACVG